MTTSEPEPNLEAIVDDELVRYFQHLGGRVERAIRSLPKDKLWVKPFPFGNSLGHLVLHLTGNLNHYVGAKIAGTGYIRDRPREFAETDLPTGEDLIEGFQDAVAMVIETIEGLDARGLATPVSEEMPIETRFGLLVVCAAHLNNHIGQMSYLVQAQGHSTQEPPAW